MTRDELKNKLSELVEEIGQVDHQGAKGILCLLMSAMEICVEDILLTEMLPISRNLLDLAEKAHTRRN